ncbi:MAG: Hsp20/alpha crystallin family protein [Leptolyngbyaceae cyanobacterium HOT.MB2.61]|jgi:HSP20 family protein|nr:Hsp20/alpha crystallin family protein [Leptolyngbyaceae cyanobacterium HOT.MB2.61]
MEIIRWRSFDLGWQPFEHMESLQRQIDQIFEGFREEFRSSSAESETAWDPAIELIDTPENLILRVQLPGVERNHLNIQATRDAVLIEGEHPYPAQSESHRWLRSEFAYGKFRRLIPVPIAIENDRIRAEFQDGILALTLPKTEQERRRVVRVSLSEPANSASTTTLEVTGETVPNGNNHSS